MSGRLLQPHCYSRHQSYGQQWPELESQIRTHDEVRVISNNIGGLLRSRDEGADERSDWPTLPPFAS